MVNPVSKDFTKVGTPTKRRARSQIITKNVAYESFFMIRTPC